MKSFFLSFIVLFLLIPVSSALAKEYTFATRKNDGTVTVSTTSNSVTIVYTHTGQYRFMGRITVWKTKKPNGSYTDKVFSDEFNQGFNTNSKTFTNNTLTPGTTYYLQINNFDQSQMAGDFVFETESLLVDPTVPVVAAKLDFNPNGGTVNVVGKIDKTKNPVPEAYDVFLEYSSQGTFTTDSNQKPQDTRSAWATTDQAGTTKGVSSSGDYYWNLYNMDPIAYWYRETFFAKNGKVVGVPILGKFKGDTGLELSDPVDAQDDFESRSYRLLAPLPGLSVLLDPDLCREKKIENPGQGQICDINYFLNFVLKIMIGLAAVVLVIRLMIEGFKIATSDVPFIKVEAKSKFWQALGGLVLALTAWLILNTINPKLVSNDISIPSVNLDIEEEPYHATIPSDPTVAPTGSIAKCTEGVTTITTKGGNFVVCKRIATQVQGLIDTAWSQGIKLSGGGFRTAAQQISLRSQNCGAAYVFVKNAKCHPPTAFPGHSNHESGLALDLTCKGVTIKTHDNECFLWLQSNASKYGLKNFYKEAWHWSVDGR